MDRGMLNYWIDIALLISFLVSAVSGIVLKVGIRNFFWVQWHTVSSFIMIFLVLVHLVLHFGWLVAMTKGLFRSKV